MSCTKKKTNKRLKKQLRTTIQNFPGTIEAAVAEEALDHDSIRCFFEDLLQHGCVSGMVGSLIYYTGTHVFYDKHYNEVEQIRHDYEAEIGQPFTTEGDWKNDMAWLAFEWVAYQMYSAIKEGE